MPDDQRNLPDDQRTLGDQQNATHNQAFDEAIARKQETTAKREAMKVDQDSSSFQGEKAIFKALLNGSALYRGFGVFITLSSVLLSLAWLVGVGSYLSVIGFDGVLDLSPVALGQLAGGIAAPLALLWVIALYIRRWTDHKAAQSAGLSGLIKNGGMPQDQAALERLTSLLENQIERTDTTIRSLVDEGLQFRERLALEAERVDRASVSFLKRQDDITLALDSRLERLEAANSQALEKADHIVSGINAQADKMDDVTSRASQILVEVGDKVQILEKDFGNLVEAIKNQAINLENGAYDWTRRINEGIGFLGEKLNESFDLADAKLDTVLTHSNQEVTRLCDEIKNDSQLQTQALEKATNAGLDQISNAVQGWSKEVGSITVAIGERIADQEGKLHQAIDSHRDMLSEKENIFDSNAKAFDDRLEGLIKGCMDRMSGLKVEYAEHIEAALNSAGEELGRFETRIDETSDHLTKRLNNALSENAEGLRDLSDSLRAQSDALEAALESSQTRVEMMAHALNQQSQTLLKVGEGMANRVRMVENAVRDNETAITGLGDRTKDQVTSLLEYLRESYKSLHDLSVQSVEVSDDLQERFSSKLKDMAELHNEAQESSRQLENVISHGISEFKYITEGGADNIIHKIEPVANRVQSLVDGLKEQGETFATLIEGAQRQSSDIDRTFHHNALELDIASKKVDDRIRSMRDVFDSQQESLERSAGIAESTAMTLRSTLDKEVKSLDSLSTKLMGDITRVQGDLKGEISQLSHLSDHIEGQHAQVFKLLDQKLDTVKDTLTRTRQHLSETGTLFKDRSRDMRESMDHAVESMQKAGDLLKDNSDQLTSISVQAGMQIADNREGLKLVAQDLNEASGQATATMHLVNKSLGSKAQSLEQTASNLSDVLGPVIATLNQNAPALEKISKLSGVNVIEQLGNYEKMVQTLSNSVENLGKNLIDIRQETTTIHREQHDLKMENSGQQQKLQENIILKSGQKIAEKLGKISHVIAINLNLKLSKKLWDENREGDHVALISAILKRDKSVVKGKLADLISGDDKLKSICEAFVKDCTKLHNISAKSESLAQIFSQEECDEFSALLSAAINMAEQSEDDDFPSVLKQKGGFDGNTEDDASDPSMIRKVMLKGPRSSIKPNELAAE